VAARTRINKGRLIAILKRKHITQRALSIAADMDQAYLCKTINQRRFIGDNGVLRIKAGLRALGVKRTTGVFEVVDSDSPGSLRG